MAKLRQRRKQGGEEKSIYRCKNCGGWHLSHLLQINPKNNAPDVQKARSEEAS
jgi:hypothetical protein